MSVWLSLGLVAAGVNLALLSVLTAVWGQNYRQHRARHTLGLLVFAGFLVVQNALWLYFYGLHPDFIGWYVNAGADVQIGVTGLCGLEMVALGALFRITWL